MYKILLTVFALIFLGYGTFESLQLLEGPQIVVDSPLSGSATSSPLVTISGTVERVAFFTVNDAPAFADASGHWQATLAPAPGYTIITLAGVDRFGRHARVEVPLTIRNYCAING